MTVSSTEYAASPSGWVISILLAVIGTLTWYYWRKNDKTTDKHTEALGLILRTQAVILQRIAPLEVAEKEQGTRLQKLDKDMAIVQEIVARHESWHERHDGK